MRAVGSGSEHASILHITLFFCEFRDIFNVDHFITSLRDEVRILKELPPRLKRRVELGRVYSMPPISWSDISCYRDQKYKVVHLNRTDARLTNNGQPLEIQKLRCRVNFSTLRFTSQIEELSRRVIKLLRKNGHFLIHHLRYEMDIEEVEELTKMRYAYPWALEIDPSFQIYITAGEIYGGERRMASLAKAYPKLVIRKETLLESTDLRFFQNHSSQMAALDYLVSLESDIFVPTYDGNMAKVVEGHRSGFIFLRINLVNLIDQYNIGSFTWDEFSPAVKKTHADRMGRPSKRVVIPDRPKEEDYFYANPEECLLRSDESLSST
ncbi:hypothetical protein I3760_15G096700 [Carya illinoinensis]|nr:hypothetical protein I3760_15G096700 [Carya illinoinensis]